MRILIVDDTPDNLLLLRTFLAKAGYVHVNVASSAEGAYQLLKLDDSSYDASMDLILMDIMMPEISGIDACRRIKADERYQDVPIIVITARTEPADLESAFAAGAMDYMTKPVNRIELLARVRSALALKRAMDARKARENELAAKNEELEQALKEVKTLRGLIPICAACKKIRDDKGYWQQLETYISDRSEARFSHGICLECMTRLYPDLIGHMPGTPSGPGGSPGGPPS